MSGRPIKRTLRGRHEELSARLVRTWLERYPGLCESSRWDLLLHLIVSHHGSGRPLVPPVIDDTADMVSPLGTPDPRWPAQDTSYGRLSTS